MVPTCDIESRISSRLSPCPSRKPTCRLRERGPKHVPKVSPTPERPKTVDDSPPRVTTNLRISPHPRVTRAATDNHGERRQR